MKCPVCGCLSFYLKDPDDAFETHEFDLKAGEPAFQSGSIEMLNDDTEAFCNTCAWHGRFAELKNHGST